MKRAVILSGNKQYLVSEGDEINVELIKSNAKTIDFEPLLTIDGEKVEIGAPSLKVKVTAEIVNPDFQDEKVTSIRFKAKKRVHTVRGHRQHLTSLKIKKIV
jgi:large subunit ribosomal protein L21